MWRITCITISYKFVLSNENLNWQMNLRLLILVCATIIVSVNAGLIPPDDNEKYVNGYRQTNLPMETLSLDPILKLEFDNYKIKHNKTYLSIDEENVRLVNFISSYIEIDRHNELMRKGQKQYTMAVNHFSDWVRPRTLFLLKN